MISQSHSVSGDSYRLGCRCLGAARELLGAVWELSGAVWEVSWGSVELSGAVWSCLGAVWKLSGSCLGAAWELSGAVWDLILEPLLGPVMRGVLKCSLLHVIC